MNRENDLQGTKNHLPQKLNPKKKTILPKMKSRIKRKLPVLNLTCYFTPFKSPPPCDAIFTLL